MLSEVILPNDTWAKIYYYADNRVEKVTVAPNGTEPKTTFFYYEQGPPRRSTVAPPNQPQITYDIGADGSVFKWWHVGAKPEILNLNGSLGFDKAGKEVPAGDLYLEVIGDSPHGITSIQVIANGNQLVSEKRCDKEPATSCPTREEDLWATDTASLAPGALNIEVIVTNGLGLSESRRWSVTIPRTPPPVPGTPVAPKFSEIQKFREDYGLEVIFPVENERQLVERIYGLINAWHSPNSPAGEVARASWERWGVPMRPADIAEMEYREAYLVQFTAAIPECAASHAPSDYAGYYVDHRAGGVVHVGFTNSQSAFVSDLKSAMSETGITASSRVETYPTVPTRSLESIGQMAQTILQQPGAGTIRGVFPDEAGGRLEVQAENVSAAQSWIATQFGAQAPVTVEPYTWSGTSGRWTRSGELMGGSGIANREFKDGEGVNWLCSAGFGAFEKSGSIVRRFVLTAGHCTKPQSNLWGRLNATDDAKPLSVIGAMKRVALEHEVNHFATDAAAITIEDGSAPPTRIYPGAGEAPTRINRVVRAAEGLPICMSGAKSNRIRHGHLRKGSDHMGFIQTPKKYDSLGEPTEWWPYVYNAIGLMTVEDGDSGGPVWQCGTGRAIGVLSADNGKTLIGVAPLQPPLPPDPAGTRWPYGFSPDQAPGILHASGMGNIQLVTAD